MNLTFHQLLVFRRIVELGSVTRASESLHLSQPAVSAQLKALQDQFDIPLTELVGRRIRITDFGHAIAGAAEAIAVEVEEIRGLAAAHTGLLTGRLRLAIVSTGQYVMPSFLAGFMEAHPGVTLEMEVTNKAQVLRNLEANRADFALVSVLPAGMNLGNIPLLPNELYLVGSASRVAQDFGSAFAKTSFAPTVLADLPFIIREPGSATRAVMEAFLAASGVAFASKMQLTSHEAVKQAVLAGLGYSIMPLIGMHERIENGSLRIVPIEGLPTTTTWQLVWPAQKRHSPAARAYLAHLSLEHERITAERFPWIKERAVL